MGPQASQTFYQWILDRTDAVTDQEHVPAVIISDTQMPDRTEAILSGNEDRVFSKLSEDAKTLQLCGCGCIAISCNTSHYFWDRLQKEVEIPILHMPRLTAQAIARDGKKKAAVFATDGTVRTGVYHRELEALGVEPWTPPEDIQRLVMSIIYEEIKAGEQGSRSKFQRIDDAARSAGCDCGILGCTELSVYRENHGLPSFYYDAMEILALECIRFFGRKIKSV